MIQLSNHNIKDVQNSMHDSIGLKLTVEQINNFAKKHPSWAGDVEENGVDTCNREGFASYIARDLLGRDWPCNGDKEVDREKFYKDFENAAKQHGYELVEDFEH